ncbi:SusC/RagA family TonB-linked outer membrane protein [Pontibacter qinzhouensis]|uniref:SusC/RagA family TonB-linked outer membrane protein n=1 Tax=Pontibacter qinzhouensis TaxID=2603253 RepID=UPI001C9C3D07|nr:SusC/RagA family TonB-linked outer membrane protein [Pontibacter qinzhouensis]
MSFLFALAGIPVCAFAQGDVAGANTDSVVVARQQVGGVEVTGTVTAAATGRPISGISVSVPEYSAAFTDDNGNFKINMPSSNSTLMVEGEGYNRKEVAVKGRGAVTVSLHEGIFNSLYDVAVLPNSVSRPISQVTAAVVSLTPEQEKWSTSAETPENLLQGRVAGLNVVRRSGTPGMGANLFLRGFNSLYTTNQPLVIVDGMIFDMNDYGGSLISNHFTNPLANLDVKDIENMTVIKDATSTYGAKGANGAIIITTAYAKTMDTKIDFAAYSGVNMQPQSLPLMNARNYRVYLNDVLKSSGMPDNQIQARPFMNDDPSAPGYYTYQNDTDWQREVFKRSYNQNYYMRVVGGDNIAKYALSMGYLDNGSIVENNNFTRYNTLFNADLNISPKLKVQTNLGFTYAEQQLSDQGNALKTDPIYLSQIKAPFLSRNERSDDGVTSPNLSDTDIFNIGNPSIITNNMQANGSNYRFFGSFNFNYSFTRNLVASTQFGVTFDKVRESFFIPRKGTTHEVLENTIAESRMGAQVKRLFAIFSDSRLAYTKTFNTIHSFDGNIGVRYSQNNSESDRGLGFNSAADELRLLGSGPSALRQAGGDIGKWLWLNYYAGANYGLLNKYFLSVNLAVDGSSRFGTEAEDGIRLFDRKFGVFPSVGAAWLISSEGFMAAADFIDLLKLRTNYSISGNDDIGNYSARQFYTTQNLLGMQGLVRGNIANPALQWETSRKLNAGLDVALFNEKVSLSVDVYRNQTDNMLVREQLSTPAGIDFMFTNDGSMVNKGVDVTLNSRVVNTSAFTWDLGITLSKYRNEITSLSTDQFTTQFAGATILTRVGQQANLFYGYKTNGIYATNEEAAQAGLRTRTPNGMIVPFQGGDMRFVNTSGDAEGLIDDNDRVVIGNPNPDFVGMFNTRFGYKRLSLNAVFTFSKGNDIYNYTRAQLESASGTENQTNAVIRRWRTDRQVTDMPRANWGDPMGNTRFSDRWIEDGSYLRLRTLTLNYDLPLNTKFLKSSSFYVSANNLFTITNYLGYDPEFSAGASIFAQGVDIGMIPQFRSVLVGVRLGL